MRLLSLLNEHPRAEWPPWWGNRVSFCRIRQKVVSLIKFIGLIPPHLSAVPSPRFRKHQMYDNFSLNKPCIQRNELKKWWKAPLIFLIMRPCYKWIPGFVIINHCGSSLTCTIHLIYSPEWSKPHFHLGKYQINSHCFPPLSQKTGYCHLFITQASLNSYRLKPCHECLYLILFTQTCTQASLNLFQLRILSELRHQNASLVHWSLPFTWTLTFSLIDLLASNSWGNWRGPPPIFWKRNLNDLHLNLTCTWCFPGFCTIPLLLPEHSEITCRWSNLLIWSMSTGFLASSIVHVMP